MWYYYRPQRRAAASPPPTSCTFTAHGHASRTVEHHRQVPRVPQGLGGRRAQGRRHLRQVRGRRDHRVGRRHRRLQHLRRRCAATLGSYGARPPRRRTSRRARASPRPTSRSRATLPGGKQVEVTALLVDNVQHRRRRVRRALRGALHRAPTSSCTTATPASGRTSARSRSKGKLDRRQVPDLLHERLRHLRLRRRLARADARAAQPRRPDRHQVHGLRHQRACRRSSSRCRRASMALIKGLADASTTPLTYEQIFRSDRPRAGRARHRRGRQRLRPRLQPGRRLRAACASRPAWHQGRSSAS